MIKITITKKLEDFWGAEGLDNGEIIDLVLEDTPALLNGAFWEIERENEQWEK